MTNQPKFEFVDFPELSETFADSLQSMVFDGAQLRIIFAVTRLGQPKPPAPPTGKRYPVCRLVLTAQAAEDLRKQLNGLAAAIQNAQQDGEPIH